MRPGRAYYFGVTGLLLIISGVGMIASMLVMVSSYSTEEACRTASGNGGSAGGSSGSLSRDYPAPPPPANGRCTGRVNDVYFEGPMEDFGRLQAEAKAAATGDSRSLGWGGLAALVVGVIMVRRARRAEDPVAHHPSERL